MDSRTDPNVTEPITYWRFEPVDPPAQVYRNRTSEGESLERMVIRSNWNKTPHEYLDTTEFVDAINATTESADFEYNPNNERHFVPPKSSQLQCEQHGMFDAYFGDPTSIKDAYQIAAREVGTLFDEGPSTRIELVTPTNVSEMATRRELPIRPPNQDVGTDDSAGLTGDRLAPDNT